jgi:hypothetical protein
MGARQSSPGMILINLGSDSTVLTEASSNTWKKYFCEHWRVTGYSLCQEIGLGVFVPFNILYSETFDVIFHPAYEG